MAEAKPIRGFGQVDLELGDDVADGTPASVGAFGQLDWEGPEPVAERPPTSSPQPISIHDDSTRVMEGDALSHLSRSSIPPPRETMAEDAANPTRMASVNENLLAVARAGETPSFGSSLVPSVSGVSARDEVAVMRELYARGDAEAALEVGRSISSRPPPRAAFDSRDASIVVEVGPELELDVSVLGREEPMLEVPLGADLTPEQRRSVPRVVRSMGEIAALPIDHRGGFLLGFVDGMQTLEEILDVCAMPAPEALEIVAQLVQLGVIEFD